MPKSSARHDRPGNELAGLIHQALADGQDRDNRNHLGGSVIGRSCEREVWLSWRWARRPDFPGRIIRLFRRGQDEEEKVVADLRAIGLEVHDTDPKTGRQFRVEHMAGHFGGSLDGAVKGVPGHEATWMVLEIKTSASKPFAKLVKQGVEKAKPEHFAQMQTYMRLTGMKMALYLAVQKDDDELYTELVPFDKGKADAMLQRAENLIKATEPPARIADSPAWYECKWCDHRDTCHGEEAPLVNCRTCVHATPDLSGDHHCRWVCGKHNRPLTRQDQEAGCEDHLYIPGLLPFADPVDADPDGAWVRYKSEQGVQFLNGLADKPIGENEEQPWSSRNIHALGAKVLTDDPLLESIRRNFGPIDIEQ